MVVRVLGASALSRGARRPRLLAAAARAALGPRAKRPGELNVVLLRKAPMRRLNRRYLGHDYDTDVIAFPYAPSREGPFGEVFISIDQAKRQARELGHSLLEELATLAVHGTLHLIGYDDRRPADRRRMFARQDRLVRGVMGRG